MFDFDGGLDSLELGSRRRPVKWAVELSLADCRPQKHKAKKRQQAAAESVQDGRPPAALQPQHAQIQQQAQAQRLAAHRKHLEDLALLQQQDPADVTPAQAKYRKEFRDSSVVCLSTEIEQGNVEYKYRLTACITNENRRHQLVTQMKFRLSEGSGECFYYLGVEDDGYPRGLQSEELQESMAIIHRMAASLQATARLVEYVPGGFGRTAALMHIKANAEEDMRVTDSRVAVAGSMDSGKSTLVAALTHGADMRPLLDNGRGSARMAVFRHKHEIESGRTSSISQQVLGYDDEGRVLNYVGVATPTPADITAAAKHMVNFLDMGGHEKYLKTTLYGMTCLLPDYALLCVDAATGITRITREHLAVAVALEVPTALVVTKADAVDEQQLQHVLEQLHQLMQPVLHNYCKLGQQQDAEQQLAQAQRQVGTSSMDSSPGCSMYQATSSSNEAEGAGFNGCSYDNGSGGSSGVPVVTSEQQAIALAAGLSELHSCTAAPAAPSFQQAVFPVFVVSCVTGAGIPLLHAFLSHLRPLQERKQGSNNSGAPGSAHAVQAGRTAGSTTRATQGAAAAESSQQQHGFGGMQPSSSSQLWGVSPKKHRPASTPASPTHPVAAAGMPVLPVAVQQSAPQQSAGSAVQEAAVHGQAEDDDCRPGHFQVVHTYDVEGVGWVVSGIAVTGTVEVGQTLLWGPTPEGGFSPVRVTCIQRSHVPVRQIGPGQTATLALQPTAPGLPHSGSKQALLTAAAVAQAAAAEAAAREAAAAIAAVPEPIAKTRRRSPAALKAAAAAAAHTAATAAAAAEAARRAAETVDGKAWWVHEAEAASAACAACQQQDLTGQAAFISTEVQAQGAPTASAAADGSVTDLLDDDFAAALALEDDSGADSESDLFGASEHQQTRNGTAARAAAPAADDDNEDLFAGLADVFDADADEQPSPGRKSSSDSSSRSSSASRLAGNWSFSSASSGGPYDSAAWATAASSREASTSSAAVSVPAGSRNLSMLSHSGSEQLLGCSPSRWRTKGGVLLDAAAAPHTYWEFEALLVLLGGFWPARGLLSGSWPPADDASAGAGTEGGAAQASTAVQVAADGGGEQSLGAGHQQVQQQEQQQLGAGELAQQQLQPEQDQAQSRSRKQRRNSNKRFEFTYVVHCNSIRQTARVVSMQELRGHGEEDADDSSSAEPGGICLQPQQHQELQHHCGLTVSIRAAAALLQGASAVHSDREGSSGCASGDSSGDGSHRQRQRQQRPGSGTACNGSSGSSVKRMSDAGSVVAVRLRFTHRPEWMQVGARLIVRDRSDGHVAAAGFVTKLLVQHTQLQQHQRELQRGIGAEQGA